MSLTTEVIDLPDHNAFADAVPYCELGGRFAKCERCSGSTLTSRPAGASRRTRTRSLYSALRQEASIVPIVEPEVLMDGDHTIDRSEEVTAAVLSAVFDQLTSRGVLLEGSC